MQHTPSVSRLPFRLPLTVLVALVAGHCGAEDRAADAAAEPAGPPHEVHLTLGQAVQFATDPIAARVAIASALADADDARSREARGKLLPAIDGTASFNRETLNSQDFGLNFPGLPRRIGPFNQWDARLHVSQTLFDAASFARWKAAKLQGRVSAENLAAAREDAAAAAAEAYIALQRAEAATGNRAENLELAKQLLALAQSQADAGTATALDLTRAKTALSNATTAQVIAAGERDLARISLARALGLPPLTAVVADQGISAPAIGTVANDANAAPGAGNADLHGDPSHAARPDLRAAYAALNAAHAGRNAVKAEYLPTIGVGGAFGPNGIQPEHTIETWSVGVQANLPILDGFAREARLDEASANERAAWRRLRDLQDQITAEVASAKIETTTSSDQVRSAAEGLKLAHDEINQAEDRFKGGLAGNIDVIDAQSALVAAEDTDLDAHVAVARAQIHLAHAFGAATALTAPPVAEAPTHQLVPKAEAVPATAPALTPAPAAPAATP
jgi:outer membrane protein TolC